jgi:hypothetical protein
VGRLDGGDQHRGLDVVGHLHEQLVGDRSVVGGLADDVEGQDVAARPSDSGGQPAETAGLVRELDMHPPQCHEGQPPPAVFPIGYRSMTVALSPVS